MVDQPKKSEKQNKTNEKMVYPPSARRIQLRNYEDVRVLLSSTINDLRQQLVDPQVARPIIYGCQVMLSVFEMKIIETDIKELQELANERYGYGG